MTFEDHFDGLLAQRTCDLSAIAKFLIMSPAVGKGAISVVSSVRSFVCLSVRPSVAYIANNSKTQRPSVPKFGRNVPHLYAVRVFFKIKGQGHQAH